MLESRDLMLSLSRAARRPALAGLVAIGTTLLAGQPAFSPLEGEFSLTRGLPGDQTHPSLSITAAGGYVVWQDYASDGQGLGLTARALNNSLSPVVPRSFRVNETIAGDQQNPVVRMLPDGSAAFVWQSGPAGQEDIFARFVSPDGLFLGGEIRVNSFTQGPQTDPQIALLEDGNLVVVWTSFGQDGSMAGVFAQRLSPTGAKLGPEFRVNVVTQFNQRSPAVAGLADGDFIVVWISEQQRFENSVDLFARRFKADGTPVTGEVLVTASANLSANPTIVRAGNDRFVIAWSSQSLTELRHGWNVIACAYNLAGVPQGDPVRLNEFTLGHQYAPKLAANGSTVLVTWTSEYQDGSREGIFGRFFSTEGTPLGNEFQVNTLAISRQIYPAVAADGQDRFLVAWSSYVGGNVSFEILAQRFASSETLAKPAAPSLIPLDSYSMMASWPELAGYAGVVNYRVFVNGASQPVVTTEPFHILTDLAPGSLHTVRVAYQTGSGQISPLSDPAVASTWGRDHNWDGLPDDWQRQYWGDDPKKWPPPHVDSDGDGATNLEEFLAGTDPTDPTSVLRVRIEGVPGGSLVSWTGVPGNVYQLMASTDLRTWESVDGLRFATGPNLSVAIPASTTAATYYRVIRIR